MSLAYVTIGTNDPEAAKPFYAAVMAELGATMTADYAGFTFCYDLPDGGRIWVTRPQNKEAATAGNGVTIGITTDGEARVNAAHTAAIKSGGVNEGDPGPRPDYGPEFYGAYVRDLDGNKLALVHYRVV
jgi:catechol 2,3-dioxygenase-like lactoylglutathione lyase family enzyme